MSQYAAGQVWKNPKFTFYVRCVNADGTVCVTMAKPLPGKKADANILSRESMDEVVRKGAYVLQPESWEPEFQRAVEALAAVRGPADYKPAAVPSLSGIGLG